MPHHHSLLNVRRHITTDQSQIMQVCRVINEDESAAAYQKELEVLYTGKCVGKDSELNQKLRSANLDTSGSSTKGQKCARLAVHLIHNGVSFEGISE